MRRAADLSGGTWRGSNNASCRQVAPCTCPTWTRSSTTWYGGAYDLTLDGPGAYLLVVRDDPSAAERVTVPVAPCYGRSPAPVRPEPYYPSEWEPNSWFSEGLATGKYHPRLQDPADPEWHTACRELVGADVGNYGAAYREAMQSANAPAETRSFYGELLASDRWGEGVLHKAPERLRLSTLPVGSVCVST